MLRQAIKTIGHCSFVLYLSFMSHVLSAQSWQELAPGIAYQDLGATLLNPWSHIHVFRIDPKLNQFDVVLANQLSKPCASAEAFAKYSQAWIALNGGFFDRKFKPLGLRVSQSQQKNPMKRISWWGVFYIKHHKAHLASARHFILDKRIEFAIQSGPRLLIDGQIPSLKPGIAERSALGIRPDGDVIILVTENTPMTTKDLAEIMKATPLSCQDALNLDGGSSSQLKADIDSFHLNVPSYTNVSDAIIVKPNL